MIGASLSQLFCAGKGQKPAQVKSSPGIVIALACAAWGCGTSSIAAVIEDDRAPIASAGSGSGSVGCDEPQAGRFVLSVESACLRRGDATTVFGDPAFESQLSADCSSVRAQWDLTPAVADTFTLRNVDTQLSLDVRTAADIPGTPIILYEPNTLDNQRFWLRPRADGYELAPRHAPQLCAEARVSGVEIWSCDAEQNRQVFRLARLSCP